MIVSVLEIYKRMMLLGMYKRKPFPQLISINHEKFDSLLPPHPWTDVIEEFDDFFFPTCMLKAMKKRDKIMTFFVGDNYKSLLNPFVEPSATFFHLSATSLLGQCGWYFK